ncbi:MAG: HAD-IIB family hydrolase, partial [Pirellulales bacterium]
MPRYRLLAIDIDGTLVNSDNELTEPTRTALLRAKQAGVEIVLATGRRYSRVLPLVQPLALNLPLVTASGALVKRASDHRTLFSA